MKTMYDIFTGGYGEFEKEGKKLDYHFKDKMIKNEKRMKKATYFFMGTMILLLLVNLYVTINEKNLYSLFGVAYCAWMSYRYVKDLRKINVKISDYENGKLDDMKVFDHEKWKNLMRTKKLERII